VKGFRFGQLFFLYLVVSFLSTNISLSVAQEYKFSPTAKIITIEELAKSLEGQPPISVGFDVDDTVLFSSPAFYFGSNKYSKGSNDYLKNIKFWEEINNGLDKFSMPKASAKKVIELHKLRGDTIYFITARVQTNTESLTQYLQEVFEIKNMQKVIFTGRSNKSEKVPKSVAISANGLKIFYGDSDNDIEDAKSVNVRAIRIIRALNSTNYSHLSANGAFGEEVLKDSAY